jgi:serine/threonine protein kinase
MKIYMTYCSFSNLGSLMATNPLVYTSVYRSAAANGKFKALPEPFLEYVMLTLAEGCLATRSRTTTVRATYPSSEQNPHIVHRDLKPGNSKQSRIGTVDVCEMEAFYTHFCIQSSLTTQMPPGFRTTQLSK